MKRLTNDQFLEKIYQQYGLKYQILEEYRNCRAGIRVLCNDCKYEWITNGHKLLSQHGCPQCGREKARNTPKWSISQKDFLKKIPFEFIKKIIVVGKYKTQHSCIEVQCRACKRVWESSAYKLYRKQGCEVCGRKRKGLASRKTHNCFIEEVEIAHRDSLSVIGLYMTGKSRINVKCNECGYKWFPVARRLLVRGCPQCCSSKGENKIRGILERNSINFKSQYYFDDLNGVGGGRLRFDFAIVSNGKMIHLIEYDGPQHFKPILKMGGEQRFKTSQKNDKIKDDYCKRNGIRLIRISFQMFSKIDLKMLGIVK